jgi:hypothetical protein
MTHLAKDFAISDVALHKICRKHGIPNPPLGWWTKKAAGKKVKQTPLPEAKPGAADRITISDGEFGRESANLAAAREQARIQASDGDDNEAAPPHPIVDRTIATLRKAKPSDIGLVTVSQGGLIKCEVAPRSVDRLAVILPRIVRAASLQGFQLVGGEGAAHFKSETEVIGFSISELVKREKHVLTDAERSKEEAWQRKRDLAARRNAWDAVLLDRPRFPEWDYHLTGQLSFEFEQVYVLGGGTGPRRSFRDAKIQRLETMASEIGVGLAVLAAAKTEQRLKREAEERRREEERRRRELAERAKHIEDRRIAGLAAILAELDELDRLRRLVAMLTTQVQAEPTPRLRRSSLGHGTTWQSVRRAFLRRRSRSGSRPRICLATTTITPSRRRDGTKRETWRAGRWRMIGDRAKAMTVFLTLPCNALRDRRSEEIDQS